MTSDKYDIKRQHYVWSQFRVHRKPVTIASIYKIARENGWQETAPKAPKLEAEHSVYFDWTVNGNEIDWYPH